MSAVIMDGKALADQIKIQIAADVVKLGQPIALGTILVGEDPGSQAYVDGKHKDCAQVGIKSIKINLPHSATTTEVLNAVHQLNKDSQCTGFIVQLPLPTAVDTKEVLWAIDPRKDADGLHPFNLGAFLAGYGEIISCTPKAILALLTHYKINLSGSKVLIIGRGMTVGRPLSVLLSQKPNNATVTLAHSATTNLLELLKQADLVIAAVGVNHFIKAGMIKKDAVVIDVGITRVGGQLIGDVDPAVSEVASFFAPMPGGVGPMTRIMLLKNLIELAGYEK